MGEKQKERMYTIARIDGKNPREAIEVGDEAYPVEFTQDGVPFYTIPYSAAKEHVVNSSARYKLFRSLGFTARVDGPEGSRSYKEFKPWKYRFVLEPKRDAKGRIEVDPDNGEQINEKVIKWEVDDGNYSNFTGSPTSPLVDVDKLLEEKALLEKQLSASNQALLLLRPKYDNAKGRVAELEKEIERLKGEGVTDVIDGLNKRIDGLSKENIELKGLVDGLIPSIPSDSKPSKTGKKA